ncbi:9537_t:CDS:2 [Acaulospora morrowiae]|uniref:9537_t:CDS:1 n=1 Tax=Acaulospora morrowiae TaxID=94023 RepID=A0A9N8V2M9_9GLOM|nr:9537_t:CDS:2 [Acaulospora morrowiae]
MLATQMSHNMHKSKNKNSGAEYTRELQRDSRCSIQTTSNKPRNTQTRYNWEPQTIVTNAPALSCRRWKRYANPPWNLIPILDYHAKDFLQELQKYTLQYLILKQQKVYQHLFNSGSIATYRSTVSELYERNNRCPIGVHPPKQILKDLKDGAMLDINPKEVKIPRLNGDTMDIRNIFVDSYEENIGSRTNTKLEAYNY